MTDYRHDIEKYLNGELTPAERNALERKALHDSFLADALEGAEQINVAEFSKDVSALNEKIASKKYVSVWMWPARIAAGLVILLASSYIVWTVMKPEPVQDLAFEKSEQAITPSVPSDSVTPVQGVLSLPSAEQPASGPVRDKDVATHSTYPSKADTNPKTATTTELEIKNEPLPNVIVAEEAKVTESIAQGKPIEKEAEVSRAKASDDYPERKTALKKKDAALATDKSETGLASSFLPNVIRGQVTAVEDGSPIPGVNVLVSGSTIGTVTNEQGNYEVIIHNSNPTLVYSFIGLQSTEVKADRSEVNVQMATDVTQLSEVVTVGYGAQAGESYPPTVDLAHPEIGNRAFKQYLEENLSYPDQAKTNKVEGRVTVQFTVEANGVLSSFTILRGIGSGCDEELIRLIKEGPKWIPTKKDNLPLQDKAKVRLKFELPK